MLEVVLATLLLNHEVQHGVSHDLHALVGDPSALVQVGVGFIHTSFIASGRVMLARAAPPTVIC